ncbi:hypothetical protein MJO29_010511 [Puccinia striiformis f. sp. tritici]|uniref:Uncharacterized protein n=1 Tax=Puccinia striiformis f. sp. tritici PST-78 TaxID=1165861 RepID=A0A0L0W1I9_9BASI|nr:hypothetical protein Pst134EA_019581 [Puccinia striiformis f. sp. tritici]KAH9459428.1 hypothetical protein Pst134EA_019581 [Puccinia striiformis f. sp. tritici]KAI7948846.1 hypothetical protein MJO29_010511 [Puccinia striiformis f. sp. tritici]KNF05337.1 hypothetical protein PSTG_01553 [Puccinia striiformis f. sp. tritici PST-78]
MAGSPTVFTTSPQEMTSAITSAPGKQHDAVPAGAPGHPSVDMARKMFEHLDSIHRLQSDIASQHQALENVDLGVEAHFKSKRTETSRGYSSYNVRHAQHHSGISGLQDPGASSENVRQQFLNRQTAVNGLMIKLSDLSVALNGIHDLGVDDTHGRSSSSQKSE